VQLFSFAESLHERLSAPKRSVEAGSTEAASVEAAESSSVSGEVRVRQCESGEEGV
jgi:hypothetical protein